MEGEKEEKEKEKEEWRRSGGPHVQIQPVPHDTRQSGCAVLTKEILNEKKKREGLKYQVMKLTKQMDKMQTVYGRLKSTKYSGNEEAFEKAREACEIVVFYKSAP